MKPVLIAVAGLLGAVRCAAAGSPPQKPAAPEPASSAESFELHPGEKITAAGGDLEVTFVSVLEDSRCPKGEQCIQAGRARLSFEATRRGGEPVRFVLDSSRESEDTGIAGYQITLTSIQPFPVSGRPIATPDYVAKIQVLRQ